jgi:hypothetical protein
MAIDEKALNKGELRKLNALRKSLGDNIADEAFAKWFAQKTTAVVEPTDESAELIVKTLEPLVLKGKIKIPRGGYLVRRGRGRVIVERGAK